MKWTTRLKTASSRSHEGPSPLISVLTLLPMLMLCSFIFFVLLGVGAVLQNKVNASPVSSMKGLAASVSSPFFLDMMGMEIPDFHKDQPESELSQGHVLSFVFQLLTKVNPADPRTLLALEVPGIEEEDTFLLHRGSGTDLSEYPVEYAPHPSTLDSEETEQATDAADPPADPIDSPEPAPNLPPEEVKQTTGGIVRAFIYHSHNRESWVPELKHKGVKSRDEAWDSKINVTLLGSRLAKKLEEEGIGAVSSSRDYPSSVKNFKYHQSYLYSLATVRQAFKQYPEANLLIDIHRDSQPRKLTTTRINGKDYAQIYFVIGHKNPNWRENEKFAKQINDILDERYPGLSRGIWGKSAKTGHGEYNQSLSPSSMLVEIGGPDNTLEESNRTIDILADVLAEVFWQAEKVDAPAPADVQSELSAMKGEQ